MPDWGNCNAASKIKKAAKHIAGYVLRNDFSQRGLQADELRNKYGFYKSKALNAMGPYLVTGIDISTFSIRTFVNGEEISVCNTQDFQWTIAEIVSYVSSLGEGISSGQFISLGTLTGGSLFELEQPQLQKGDVVKLVGNQAFGTLENAIVN